MFLKTSEEAKCAAAVCQNYQFTSSLPTVTGVQAVYDSAAHVWQVQVTGTSFLSQGTAATLFVNEVEQSMASITSTLVNFHLTSVPNHSVTNMKLYFDIGAPAGSSLVSAGVTIYPQIKEVLPSLGTTQGTLMIIDAPGVGSNETGYTVMNSTGASICRSVRAVAYGRLECLTNQSVIAATQVSIKQDSSSSSTATYTCANQDTTKCAFEQPAATSAPPSSLPDVSDVQAQGAPLNQVVFTGTNFFTTGYSALATFHGIAADTVTVDSATQVTATWTHGLPLVATPAIPALGFQHTTDGFVYNASQTGAQPVANALSLVSSTSSPSCSFAGGCAYEL